MQRNLNELSKTVFDLLVIGGGIYGACVAYEATLRGLSVALVEKQDFCGATSANSLKTIHGGLRYLQHADFKRMRESIGERRTLMKIAPHLVHPLPVLVPTYGHGLQGIEAMTVALKINDWVSCDRNLGLPDPQKHIPAGRTLTKKGCLETLPGLSSHGLTGAAVFYDAQVYNSERLVISYLQSAAQAGACLANYTKVTGFLQDSDRVQGVTVKDELSDAQFDIHARIVVNTSGPWINQIVDLLHPQPNASKVQFASAMNLVTRPLFEKYAVGIYGQTAYQDQDAILKKQRRLFFISPWRHKSIVGTVYNGFTGHPDQLEINEQEINTFLDEVNQAYPPANLTPDDISFVHKGLLPCTSVSPATGVQLCKHFRLYDHAQEGVQGLLSVTGVKYTTARQVAEETVRSVFEYLDKPQPESQSKSVPLSGGEIEQFDVFLNTAIQKYSTLDEQTIRRLVYSYGSRYTDVLASENAPSQASSDPELNVVKAETLHAIRQEMAQTLSDVIFRRTELGSAEPPKNNILQVSAKVMGQELGWSSHKIQQEIDTINTYFNRSQINESIKASK